MAAIYMWFEAGIEFLTTTLYPIEMIDELQLNFNITDSSMSPIPQDSLNLSYGMNGVILNQILIAYGPNLDELDISAGLVSVLLNQILLSYGPNQDELDISYDLVNVQLVSLLVTADTPDEKLQLDFNISSSGCSMTPV